MIYDGKKIAALREERGLSMAELARRAKIKQPSLWAIEHQQTKKPKADTMMRIAAALGVTIQSLMGKTQGVTAHLESELLSSFHSLTPENQGALIAAAQALHKSQKRG